MHSCCNHGEKAAITRPSKSCFALPGELGGYDGERSLSVLLPVPTQGAQPFGAYGSRSRSTSSWCQRASVRSVLRAYRRQGNDPRLPAWTSGRAPTGGPTPSPGYGLRVDLRRLRSPGRQVQECAWVRNLEPAEDRQNGYGRNCSDTPADRFQRRFGWDATQ